MTFGVKILKAVNSGKGNQEQYEDTPSKRQPNFYIPNKEDSLSIDSVPETPKQIADRLKLSGRRQMSNPPVIGRMSYSEFFCGGADKPTTAEPDRSPEAKSRLTRDSKQSNNIFFRSKSSNQRMTVTSSITRE